MTYHGGTYGCGASILYPNSARIPRHVRAEGIMGFKYHGHLTITIGSHAYYTPVSTYLNGTPMLLHGGSAIMGEKIKGEWNCSHLKTRNITIE